MRMEGNVLKKVTNEDIVSGTINIPNGITEIGECAFYNCTFLESIIIPNSVVKIGVAAFCGCKSLKKIDIPSGVRVIGIYVFYGCESLEKIKIPNSVTEIDGHAFYGCKSLKKIDIPSSVTEIYGNAFYGCESLEKIEIPNSVTEIGDDTFSACTNLEKIEIPNSVMKIGQCAFCGCASLRTATIPNSVTEIGDWAFDGCTSLKSIIIPNSLTRIGACVFQDCTSLKKIEIPSSVTEIDEHAFYGCKSLKKIDIPNSVTVIGTSTFNNCTSLENITIPNSVTRIGDAAFYKCTSLKNVKISNSIIGIGMSAFAGCTSLENIDIPDSIKWLNYTDFSSCNNLNLNILTSLVYFEHRLINFAEQYDSFFSVNSITIYGQKMDKDNFKQELDNVRRKELLDKIITYFINNNILDIKHYKYSLHRNFIEEIVKKYSDSIKYYNYKDDFNKYMEDYINKNHLRKEIMDKEIDDILIEITDKIKNYSIEELDTSSSINIINYGEELLKMPIKIDDVLTKIIENYGPTNTLLEKELKKFRSPRNIAQYLDNVKDQEEKIYFGKNSIDFLIYCNDYNSYRLNLGIKKLKELQSILKMYEEKLNGDKNYLVNYKSISINGNELHKMDDSIIEREISSKIINYTNQIILVKTTFYAGVQNLINMYQIYMNTLEKSKILLENIKRGRLINKGVITDGETVESLNELLEFYEDIDGKRGKKNSK